MADRKGSDLRRVLRSADLRSDLAMRLGSDQVKTPDSRSSAWLSRVTLADHRPVSFRLELANAGHPDYGQRQPAEATVSRTSTSPFVDPAARAL